MNVPSLRGEDCPEASTSLTPRPSTLTTRIFPKFMVGDCSVACAFADSCPTGFSLGWAKLNWKVAARERMKSFERRIFIPYFVNQRRSSGKINLRFLLSFQKGMLAFRDAFPWESRLASSITLVSQWIERVPKFSWAKDSSLTFDYFRLESSCRSERVHWRQGFIFLFVFGPRIVAPVSARTVMSPVSQSVPRTCGDVGQGFTAPRFGAKIEVGEGCRESAKTKQSACHSMIDFNHSQATDAPASSHLDDLACRIAS